MPTASDFRTLLEQKLRLAQIQGYTYIDITAGELHRELGGYPNSNHRMSTCCDVMRQHMRVGDIVP